MGITIRTEEEDAEHDDIFAELKLDRDKYPVEPLFEGKWE